MEKNGVYTMEQFKEMYDDAVLKVAEKMSKEFHDAKEDRDPMDDMVWNLQNLLAFHELKNELFKDEESE